MILSPLSSIYLYERTVLDNILATGMEIYPVDSRQADYLESILIGSAKRINDAGQFDYLYSISRLSQMKGSALKSHRQAVQKLLRSHEVTIEPIAAGNISAAVGVVDRWVEEKAPSMVAVDGAECIEALQFLLELRLDAFLFLVDGRAEGVTVTDCRFDNMVVALFQKVVGRRAGLSTFCLMHTATLASNKSYLNVCQDLDNPGLRAWKRSLRPDLIVEKYFVGRPE